MLCLGNFGPLREAFLGEALGKCRIRCRGERTRRKLACGLWLIGLVLMQICSSLNGSIHVDEARARSGSIRLDPYMQEDLHGTRGEGPETVDI